jgi:hypothetical protein
VHSSDDVFPAQASTGKSPLVPISPSEPNDDHPTVRDDLSWDVEALSKFDWLRPLLDVPDDASPPLWMSRPPEQATGTYGWDAIASIEESQGITLRWWQKLAIVRQLEHDADGRLVHREILESCPRRSGKSVRMKVTSLWRLATGPSLFGETQLVMHTASDMAIAREIQRQAWRWAEEKAHWTVSRSNGKEAIETKHGDRWLIRAQGAVYGYDVTLGVVDEAWDVSPECVSEGIEPAMLERQSPQLHLTSTAHRRATSLMRGRLSAALAVADPTVLLLVWAAPFGADISDPEVWKAASPHWSEDRHRMIASKHAKALAGEDDKEFDDPNPLEGFAAQFLNQWKLTERRQQKGEPVIEKAGWGALTEPKPTTPPTSAAIESWFSDGVSLALGWHVDGRAVVSAQNHPDLASAVAALKASGFRGAVTVGSSLTEDPALRTVRKKPGTGRTGAAASELRGLLREQVVRHDGGDHLAGQVLAMRTAQGADGPRMASVGRADAVKAAVWAALDARKPRPALRIILPSGVVGE